MVVIIFSTVVLGIVGILKEQQIGTLLAAIAGYVLGKATTRSARQSNSQEGMHPKEPATLEVKVSRQAELDDPQVVLKGEPVAQLHESSHS